MMIQLELLEEKDFRKIVEWNEGKDTAFLYQWAGPGYEYPITTVKIKDRFDEGVNQDGSDTYIYKILDAETNQTIGTIELFRIDREKRSATIGRFLIGEAGNRNRGYGKSALEAMVQKGFLDFELEKLSLNVFDFNHNAIRCYKNAGFKKVSFREHVYETAAGTWGVFEMTITRSDWKSSH
ncbi:MAG: GNAT family N-acetyltransferase [Clostridia bacterium]|nr:GNAT family N-acetyltransferase [Clostridia bacterium]